MSLYYDFSSTSNLEMAQKEYHAIIAGQNTETPFVSEVKKADLVIDFSGDIWGDNADFLGKDRFLTGCYKDLTAQTLRPTVMLAGSPGPFQHEEVLGIAKKAYAGFSLVVNREPVSTRLLKQNGFDITNTKEAPCPSFLFKKAEEQEIQAICQAYALNRKDSLKIGLMFCGWNFARGPFDAWPREPSEYQNIISLAEELICTYDAHLYLLSHSNGFQVPPNPFELIHGRDFPIMQQLNDLLLLNHNNANHVHLMDGIYPPHTTKAIVSHFDILISGRMHGAVSGLSQGIPTMIIDYGHEPKAHKLRGFAEVAGMSSFIADPNSKTDLKEKAALCIRSREEIRKRLESRMQFVQQAARSQFDLLKPLI